MGEIVSGRVASPSGSHPADQAASHPAPAGFDPSREPELDRASFHEILSVAYDWALDDEGYLWGLTAGDQGYEQTDMKLVDLFTNAQIAEWDRFYATGVKAWPVQHAVTPFIRLLAKSINPPAPAMEAAAGGRDPSGLDPKDDSAVREAKAPDAHPLPQDHHDRSEAKEN